MQKKEYLEAYQCGKGVLKVGDKEYHPGEIIPTMGDITSFALQTLIDGGSIFKVLVVTPGRFKQLTRNASRG